MNDLHDTLTNHLHHTAEQATPWPQPEAITDGVVRLRFTSTSQHEPRHPARRGLLVAAAAVTVLGGVGAIAFVSNGPSRVPAASSTGGAIEPVHAAAETATSTEPTAGDAVTSGEVVANDIVGEPVILAEGPVTQFESLTPGQTLTIVANEDFSVVGRYEPATTAPYCVDLELGGFSGPACVDQTSVFDGRTSFALPSNDGTRQLVGQVVTDLVDTVTTSDGRSIEPVKNVWWDVTDIGSPITYTVHTNDGRITEAFPISAD